MERFVKSLITFMYNAGSSSSGRAPVCGTGGADSISVSLPNLCIMMLAASRQARLSHDSDTVAFRGFKSLLADQNIGEAVMKMVMDIRIGKKKIGRVEIEGIRVKKNGKTVYEVDVYRDGIKFEMNVEHRRHDGPFKLMEIICRKASKMVDEYYSYPKEKAENGLIRGSDIPERYKKEFGKFFGVGTVSLLPRRCPEGCMDVEKKPDEETAYNLSDLENFLDNRRWGRGKVWD